MTAGPVMPPVAILAGGLATRLRPLTETIPKALIPIAGRPFIEYQLESLKRQGVERVVICVGFLGEAIREACGDGRRTGIRIDYSFDGPRQLGTGGAIRKALPLLGHSFMVLYGDSYLQIDLPDVIRTFERSGKPALLSVFANHGAWDSSNVIFVDGRILMYDKHNRVPEMQYIDYGLSVFKAGVFEDFETGDTFDLSDVIHNLSCNDKLAAYEARHRFYEIGSPAGLDELTERLAGMMLETEKK
jgi:N-acetyl-alpha-D-muramate 1-phosphate uridylyltransferase